MNLTLAILLAAAIAYLTKLSGYLVPTDRLDRDKVNELAGALTVGLLAALIVTNTFATPGGHLAFDARVVALGAAAIALLARAPFIFVVVIGAVAAAITRGLGWG